MLVVVVGGADVERNWHKGLDVEDPHGLSVEDGRGRCNLDSVGGDAFVFGSLGIGSPSGFIVLGLAAFGIEALKFLVSGLATLSQSKGRNTLAKIFIDRRFRHGGGVGERKDAEAVR